MSPEMNVFRLTSLVFSVYFLLPDVQGRIEGDISEHKVSWDKHYQKEKDRSDLASLPYRRISQLYSRNSGRHLRIHADHSVDANGKDSDKNGKLIVESDRFGSVRIRGSATNLYLCMDKRGRLRGRERGIGKENCVFQELFAANAYTEFKSVKYPTKYIAFTRKGAQRTNRTRPGTKAVQFIIRPLRVRLYKGQRHNNQQRQRITISAKKWKQFKNWLKWRRQQRESILDKPENSKTVQASATPTLRPKNTHQTTVVNAIRTAGENLQLHFSTAEKP